ncbi:MAG TPA: pyridoxal-phosphate dependent enzyme [Fimbriimonadaceae bacterium]
MHALSNIALPTTLIKSRRLSDTLNAEVLLATETFQHNGSFKFRAAYNTVASVPNDHFVVASSGNFGQALAYACSLVGKKCHVVMPQTSSKTKVQAVRDFGGIVDLIDVKVISRSDRVKQLSEEYPAAYIASAYDDEFVIAGNATLGVEIIESGEPLDVVIAPLGGGGLTSGLIRAFAREGVKVYGAEPAMANDGARSLREGHIVQNETEPQTLADGARTLSLGHLNWPVLQHGIAGIVEVSEESIVNGLKLLYSKANLKSEPTGALAVGALLQEPKRFEGKKVCCVISGGNVDPELYASLIV